jgi:hypothetical protein
LLAPLIAPLPALLLAETLRFYVLPKKHTRAQLVI